MVSIIEDRNCEVISKLYFLDDKRLLAIDKDNRCTIYDSMCGNIMHRFSISGLYDLGSVWVHDNSLMFVFKDNTVSFIVLNEKLCFDDTYRSLNDPKIYEKYPWVGTAECQINKSRLDIHKIENPNIDTIDDDRIITHSYIEKNGQWIKNKKVLMTFYCAAKNTLGVCALVHDGEISIWDRI